MVAAEDALEAPISRRYWEPPCCMPKVSQHFKGARERYGSALLPNRQGGEEKGNYAILPPTASYMKDEIPIWEPGVP